MQKFLFLKSENLLVLFSLYKTLIGKNVQKCHKEKQLSKEIKYKKQTQKTDRNKKNRNKIEKGRNKQMSETDRLVKKIDKLLDNKLDNK